MALVFKCLTDNILLDDFKSVLQKLGAMKIDGTDSSLPSGSNFNSRNKSLSAVHQEGEVREQQNQGSNQIGLSAALQDEIVEDSRPQYERQNGSPNENGVGRFGMKIKKLPRLPFSGSRDNKEEKKP